MKCVVCKKENIAFDCEYMCKKCYKKKKRIMYEICLVDITLIMAICLTYYMIGI